MKPRFGVVGTAHWARRIHLPGLLAAGADVVGLWGRTGSVAQEIAAEHGVRAFESFDALLEACDAVTMAVPPDVQADLALRAAQAGKHMIVEKPLTRDVESAQRIAHAAAEKDLAGLVFFVRRFIPDIAAAIEAERAHPWTQATIKALSGVMAGPSPYANSVWRKAPGAALWDITPHVLSVLIPMMGEVEAIEAQLERDGVTQLRTWHRRGGVADISVSLHSGAADVAHGYRFVSETKSITLPEPELSHLEVFGRAVKALTDAIETGARDLPCGLTLGVDVVDWLQKAELSQRLGRKVS